MNNELFSNDVNLNGSIQLPCCLYASLCTPRDILINVLDQYDLRDGSYVLIWLRKLVYIVKLDDICLTYSLVHPLVNLDCKYF